MLSRDLDIVAPAVHGPPRFSPFRQYLVERLDILDAAVVEPALEPGSPLLGIDRDGVLPGRAAAQHTREVGPRFGRQLKRLAEDLVGYAGAEVDKRLGGGAGGAPEEAHRLFAGVGGLAAGEGARARDEFDVDRDLDFQHVDAVARLRELLHVAGHIFGLLA